MKKCSLYHVNLFITVNEVKCTAGLVSEQDYNCLKLSISSDNTNIHYYIINKHCILLDLEIDKP